MNKCIKGESCLHCDTDYCRFKDEVAELKAKIFELKESLKCFQTPEAIKALTFYKTGEFELQEKKCIKLEQENERLKSIVESNNQQVEQAELLVMDNDRLQQEVENLKDTIYYDVGKYRQALQEIREYCEEQNLKADYTACEIIAKINEALQMES